MLAESGHVTRMSAWCDADYDDMLGAPKRAIVYDWYIRAYRYVTMQPLRTPADAVTPGDVDAVIADDGTGVDGNARIKRRPQTKTLKLLRRLRALLEDGPLSVREMINQTGETPGRVISMFREMPDGMHIVGRNKYGNVYGLIDKEYDMQLCTPLMQQVIDHIRDNGPSTAPQIADELGLARSTVSSAIRDYPDFLRRIGRRKPATGGKPAIVWDLEAAE